MTETQTKRDYYAVLGIPKDADLARIKDAFRQLALKYHPDRNHTAEAAERFKEIAGAYAVLSDPEKRSAYDAQGFPGVTASEEDLFRSVDFGDLLADFDLGLSTPNHRATSLFERLFGYHRPKSPRGTDIEVDLEVSLARIASGGEELLRYHRRRTCESCRGTGARDGVKLHPCDSCGGTGRRTKTSRQRESRGQVVIRSISACASCEGHGQIIEEICQRCRGLGSITAEDSLTIQIPKGIEDGMILRVAGYGLEASSGGGKAGDLFVVIRAAPDASFERHHADLWHTETLTIPEAVLGGSRKIPTLDGSLDVTIPPGAQPGLVLRCAGQGLPRFDSDGRGDLYVRLDLMVPRRLTARERELYTELQRLLT